MTQTPEASSISHAEQVLEPVDGAAYETVARLAMPDTSGMAFDATTTDGFTIRLDAETGEGGAKSGPEPLGLILLAVGACAGMDAISILRKKRQNVTAYTVNVYANQAKGYPNVYTELMVEHVIEGQGVDPKAVARALELSLTKYCPANDMVAKAAKVEHVFRILDSTPG